MHSRLIFQGFSLFQFSQLPNKNKFLTGGWGLDIWGWNNLKSSCVSVASTRPLNLRPPPSLVLQPNISPPVLSPPASWFSLNSEAKFDDVASTMG